MKFVRTFFTALIITGMLLGATSYPSLANIVPPVSRLAHSVAIVGVGAYDDTNANITYSGTWANWSGPTAYNGTLHYSTVVGSNASLSFNGTQVSLIYSGHPSRGVISVTIDGLLITTINEYNATAVWQMRWDSPLLSSGDHTVVFCLCQRRPICGY